MLKERAHLSKLFTKYDHGGYALFSVTLNKFLSFQKGARIIAKNRFL